MLSIDFWDLQLFVLISCEISSIFGCWKVGRTSSLFADVIGLLSVIVSYLDLIN